MQTYQVETKTDSGLCVRVADATASTRAARLSLTEKGIVWKREGAITITQGAKGSREVEDHIARCRWLIFSQRLRLKRAQAARQITRIASVLTEGMQVELAMILFPG